MDGSRRRDEDAQSEHDDAREEAGQSRWTWIVPLATVALLGLLYLVVPSFNHFVDTAYGLLSSGDQQGFERWVRDFGAWGPAVVLAMMVMQTLVAVIPSVLIMVVTVLAFGPWWGGLLTWGGLMVAAFVAYTIGRAVGPATLNRLIGESTERKVEGFVEDYGVWAIVAARVSPALSTDAVSFVAGLAKMNALRFALGTGAGILPLTVLIAFLGADIERLQSGLIWVSVASVVIFVGYVIYDRRRGEG